MSRADHTWWTHDGRRAAFVAWAVDQLPHRRACAEVAALLWDFRELAGRQRRRWAFFTHCKLARQRGKLHRNTTRQIIRELAAAEGSAVVVQHYSERHHHTSYTINPGRWIAQGFRLLGKAGRSSVGHAYAWRQRRHARQAERQEQRRQDATLARIRKDAERLAAAEQAQTDPTPSRPLTDAQAAGVARLVELQRQHRDARK